MGSKSTDYVFMCRFPFLRLQIMWECVDSEAAGVRTPNLQIGGICRFGVSAFMSSPRAWADRVDLHIEPLAIG